MEFEVRHVIGFLEIYRRTSHNCVTYVFRSVASNRSDVLLLLLGMKIEFSVVVIAWQNFLFHRRLAKLGGLGNEDLTKH